MLFRSAGNDIIWNPVNLSSIDGGTGTDTIALTGTSASLNALADSKLVNVEAIDASTASASVVIALGLQTEGFTITGSAYADTITGGFGVDTIVAGAGDDTIIGVSGLDTIDGGDGRDTVRISATSAALNSLADSQLANVEVVSAANAAAGVTINLSKQSDGFSIVGSTYASSLTGSTGNDNIQGGNGNDTINGGLGNDTLTGGLGQDRFVFNSAITGGNNVDVITDFNPVNDSLQLSSAVFSGLAVSNGQLAASAFALDTATGSAAQVVYDSHTGALYYDSNGSGAGGSTQFAVLQGAPNLTEKQIFVV